MIIKLTGATCGIKTQSGKHKIRINEKLPPFKTVVLFIGQIKFPFSQSHSTFQKY